MTEFMMIFRND